MEAIGFLAGIGRARLPSPLGLDRRLGVTGEGWFCKQARGQGWRGRGSSRQSSRSRERAGLLVPSKEGRRCRLGAYELRHASCCGATQRITYTRRQARQPPGNRRPPGFQPGAPGTTSGILPAGIRRRGARASARSRRRCGSIILPARVSVSFGAGPRSSDHCLTLKVALLLLCKNLGAGGLGAVRRVGVRGFEQSVSGSQGAVARRSGGGGGPSCGCSAQQRLADAGQSAGGRAPHQPERARTARHAAAAVQTGQSCRLRRTEETQRKGSEGRGSQQTLTPQLGRGERCHMWRRLRQPRAARASAPRALARPARSLVVAGVAAMAHGADRFAREQRGRGGGQEVHAGRAAADAGSQG